MRISCMRIHENPGPRDEAKSDRLAKLHHPDVWKSGDEPMTPAQNAYLKTLCLLRHEPYDPSLSKAEASKMIERLKETHLARKNAREFTPMSQMMLTLQPAPGGR